MLVQRSTPRPEVTDCAQRDGPRVPWTLLALGGLTLLLLVALPPAAHSQASDDTTLPAGAAVRGQDGDAIPVLSPASGLVTVCVGGLQGAAPYAPGDPVYYHSGSCTEPVATGDLRLEGSGFGTKVAATDLDHGTALRAGPVVASAMYDDRDRDGRWGPGDAAYLKLAGAGGAVAVGDVRLGGEGIMPGSPVRAGDSDVGHALLTGGGFVGRPGVDWQPWDADGNGRFDGADAMYLDLDDDERPGVLDLRVTPFPGQDGGAGAVLDRLSLEVVPSLEPATTGSLCFTDDNADGLFSPEERVFFHRASSCSALLAGDVRLTGPGYGVALGPDDAETGRPSMETGAGGAYVDGDGDGVWSAGDTLYAARNSGTPVALGDLRLTPYGDLPAGSSVKANDPDVHQSTSTLGIAWAPGTDWQSWDASGDGRLGGDDVLYIDVDSDDHVSAADVRVSPLGDAPGGGVVGVGAPDLRGFLEPAFNSDACYQDADGDNTYGTGDPVVVRLGSCSDNVHAGDVRLTGPAFGDKMRGTDPDARATWIGLLTRVAFLDRDRDGFWGPGDTAYLQATRTGTFPSTISTGDIRLTPFDAKGPGTWVGATDGDAGATALTPQNFHAALGQDWRAWDVDGDALFGGDDGLYVDANADGQVTVLDIRLTPVIVPSQGSAQLSLEVAVAPAAPIVDQEVTFRVTLRNNGTLPAVARVATCVGDACLDERAVTVSGGGAQSWDVAQTFRAAGAYTVRASSGDVEATAPFTVMDAPPLDGNLTLQPAGQLQVGEQVTLVAAVTSHVGSDLVAGTLRICDNGTCESNGPFGVIRDQTLRRTTVFDQAGNHRVEMRFEFSGKYAARPALVLASQAMVAGPTAPPPTPQPPPAPVGPTLSLALSLDVAQPVKGQATQLSVTVRNTGADAVPAQQYRVHVCVAAPGERMDDCPRSVRLDPLPALSPGASTTQQTGLRFEAAGDNTVRATVEGTPEASGAPATLAVTVRAGGFAPGPGPGVLVAALAALGLLTRPRARA